MFASKRKLISKQKREVKYVRILCFLTITFCFAVSFLLSSITPSANSAISLPNSQNYKSFASTATPDPTPSALLPQSKEVTTSNIPDPISPAQNPSQTQALRIKIIIGETQDVPTDTAITSFLVVSPEIAAVQAKNGNILTINGLKVGETILIVSHNGRRQTFVVEVVWKPAPVVSERQSDIATQREKATISGSVNVQYVHGFDKTLSGLRQSVQFQRKLSNGRTLRAAGELFKFFNKEDSRAAFGRAQNFGLNRLSLGLDSRDKKIDFLDSQINFSRLGFNSLTMRGFHLVSAPKPLPNRDQDQKGIEVFAGLARPSLRFFDNNQGKIVGAILPFASSESWRARAGFTKIVPEKNNKTGTGGTLLQLSSSYTPDKRFSVEGEMAYANGGISWQARSNLKLKQIGGFAEIIRFDRNSPLNSIGIQLGGRRTETFGLYWKPEKRFNFFVSYNHTEVTQATKSRLDSFNNSSFSASANYRFSKNSTFNLNFLNQKIETTVSGSSSKFQIETRTFTLGHDIRFNQKWSNNFEARINFSQETGAKAELENGFYIKEQLRFSLNDKTSFNGFFNYNSNTPSVASLIVRNPRLLPLPLQEAFTLNPIAFLQLYRDRLTFLLNGIELPQSSNLDTGLRLETSVSRFTVSSENRYAVNRFLSRNQNNFATSLNLNLRIDNANSLQISARHIFGGNNQSALTFSFTHRFGAGSGDGFQISKLFGFNKGRVRGRVYYDLNANGHDDIGEPGAVGMTIQLDKKKSVKTDLNGHYQFTEEEGGYNISLVSDALGVRWRASTATEQKILLSSGKTANASFGLSDFGFVSGQVFNDSNLSKAGGVRIILRASSTNSSKSVVEQITGANGAYEFQNVAPGTYTLEIDPTTIPSNFQLPAQIVWQVKVEPLQRFYLDIPISAQRAVAGFVFVDTDGDGKFNPQKDNPVEGAIVKTDYGDAVSDNRGAYILRNLPAGKITLRAFSPVGKENSAFVIELEAEPVTKRGVNIALKR